MRPIERIPIFLKLVDWVKLSERWDLEQPLHYMSRKLRTYWLQNPDQRCGQVFINLGVLLDRMNIWCDEESSILNDQGVSQREFMLWGSNYDKNMNPLPKTIWRPIIEMSTDHIENILEGGWAKNPAYKKAFKDELELRKQLPIAIK